MGEIKSAASRIECSAEAREEGKGGGEEGEGGLSHPSMLIFDIRHVGGREKRKKGGKKRGYEQERASFPRLVECSWPWLAPQSRRFSADLPRIGNSQGGGKRKEKKRKRGGGKLSTPKLT